jgi:hypothetical protein
MSSKTMSPISSVLLLVFRIGGWSPAILFLWETDIFILPSRESFGDSASETDLVAFRLSIAL